MRRSAGMVAMVAVLAAAGGPLGGNGLDVQVVRRDADERVDVTVGGKPFTSYIWRADIKKPSLYPIRTAQGTLVTRGYPIDPRPSERTDHPHHVGLWFNHGNVNGIDFWNNSTAAKPENRDKLGTVVHRAVTAVRSGTGAGELETEADWVMPDGTVALKQKSRYGFSGTPATRTIDLAITLTAQDSRVTFNDSKEGTLGLRVTRALEEPSKRPEMLTDAQGRAETTPRLDNTGVNGVYFTSEGKKGAEAWGTRGKWCTLTGRIGDELVTIAILDHPQNPGHPTYWHARGYGLFAANPLGQKELSGGKQELNLSLEPGESATFRYRVLITSGDESAASAESAWKAWTSR